MSHRPASLLLALLAVAACQGDDPPATGEAGACPLREPTLLAAAPEFFAPQRDTYYGLHVVGEELLFTFDRPEDPERVYWRKSLCGGEPERYTPLAPGLHNPLAIDGPDGPLLYANNRDHEFFVLDRLAVPGADPRRKVTGLPARRLQAYGNNSYDLTSSRDFVVFYAWSHDPDADRYNAAGVNADTNDIYTHAGDPDVPAWHLGDDLVGADFRAGDPLVHHLDGTLERVDPKRRERELLLADVRHFTRSPDGALLLWQALGDGVAEPVYLRRLDDDDDLEVALNDFNAASWQHAPNGAGIVGSWRFTADGAHAALLGPEGAYVAAIATDTGAPIAVPAHLHASLDLYSAPDQRFGLVLADEDEHVEALWDLKTGELREWYRGDHDHPTLIRVDGDVAEFFLASADDWSTGSLHRVDLGTGETTELFPAIPRAFTPGEREYVAFGESRMVDAFFLTHTVFYPQDILAIDVETRALRRIADDAPEVVPVAGGWVFLDLFSDEPGLRALPRPQ